MKQTSVDFTKGPLLPEILNFAIPVALSSLIQLLFNAADLIVLGRFCGPECVAAVGSTSAICALFINFFIGLSQGSGIVVANKLGAKDDNQVSKAVHTAIPVALLGGIFISVFGLIFTRPVLQMMDNPAETIDLATLYMKIYLCGSIPNLVYNFGASILRSDGDSKKPMTFITISGFLNIFLNIFFVTVVDLSVAGVALATVLSQMLSAVLIIRELMKRKNACRLYLKKMKIDRIIVGKIVSIGFPAGIQSCMFAISNSLVQASVNSFGADVMSGNSAAMNLGSFVYNIMYSFNHTAVAICGQNAGANNIDRVRKTTFYCATCAAIVGIISGSLVNIFATPLLNLYIKGASEVAFKAGKDRLLIVALPYLLSGIMDSVTGSLKGLGKSFESMIIAIIGIIGIRVAWILIIFPLEKFHSVKGLFACYPLTWFFTGTAMLVAYLITTKKMMNEHEPR